MSIMSGMQVSCDRLNLVYIHIGKTSGTSLRVSLDKAFSPGSCSAPFVQSYISKAEAKYYQSFRVMCGHISRSYQLKWFPNRSVITVLREPIDRALSFIYYVLSLPGDSSVVAADAHRLPLLDFIETEIAQQNLYNTMVRQLGGHMLDEPADLPALLEGRRKPCAKRSGSADGRR